MAYQSEFSMSMATSSSSLCINCFQWFEGNEFQCPHCKASFDMALFTSYTHWRLMMSELSHIYRQYWIRKETTQPWSR
jgi:hypothetical protein